MSVAGHRLVIPMKSAFYGEVDANLVHDTGQPYLNSLEMAVRESYALAVEQRSQTSGDNRPTRITVKVEIEVVHPGLR